MKDEPVGGSPRGADDKKAFDHHAETVEALVAEARFHEEFEESRLSTNNQRAGWLLALNGVILGLIANQAREMLTQARLLGEIGRWVASISLGVAAAFVLFSACFALRVIFSAGSWTWDDEEIEGIAETDSISRTKAAAEGDFLEGIRERILAERRAYEGRSKALKAAFICLAIGLAAVAVHIGVYSVRTIENPCPYAGQTQSPYARELRQAKVATTPLTLLTRNWTEPASAPRAMPVGDLIKTPKGGKCTR